MALHAGEVLVGVFDDGHRAEFTVLGTAMNRLARIEARAKAANLTLAGSYDLVRLLSPAVHSRLHLADMPPSDCPDTRDMRLFAVSWHEGAEALQDEAITPAA